MAKFTFVEMTTMCQDDLATFAEALQQMVHWCNTNCIGWYRFHIKRLTRSSPIIPVFVFENNDDALLFKLTWF